MKKKNILSGVLASALLITSLVTSMPVFAAGEMTTGDSTQANTNVKYEREASQIVVSIPAEVTLSTLNSNDFATDSENAWNSHFKGASDIDITTASNDAPKQLQSVYRNWSFLARYSSSGYPESMFLEFFEKYYDCVDTISVSQAPDDISKKLVITIADTSFTLTGTSDTLTAYAEFPYFSKSIGSGSVASQINSGIYSSCNFAGFTSSAKVPVTFFYYGDVTPDTYTGTVTFNMEITSR